MNHYDPYSQPYQQQMLQGQQHRMPRSIQTLPNPDPYSPPQNLPAALQLIAEAVTDEFEDRKFYNYLISIAPAQEDKDIITGIRNDEMKHFDLFRNIYSVLTDKMPPQPIQNEFKMPASYCAGLKQAMLGELAAVERYRKILFAMQERIQINMLTEIITDELRHGSFYNYLLLKNRCS